MAKKVTPKAKPEQRQPRAVHKGSPGNKHTKPLFTMGTIITVLLLAGLVGFALYINHQKNAPIATTPTSSISLVFTKADGNPTSIEIKPATGQSFKLSRDAKNIWAIDLPSPAEANQGLAEAAATQISALVVVSAIKADPGIFGLDKPAYMITIGFDNGRQHILEIGDLTPTSSGYYVRLDKNKMMIADFNGIDSLLKLPLSPPYLNTPIPSPLPTTAAVPAPGATVTPTP
jgi:hypothetical protein